MNWQIKKERQFNTDLDHSSINIAAETTPYSHQTRLAMSKAIMNWTLSVEGKFYRVHKDSFITSRFWFWPWIQSD